MNLEKRVEELEQKLEEALRRISELEKENSLLRDKIKEKHKPTFVKDNIKEEKAVNQKG